jgi:DNA-binding transcriptional ArsR family regulator
MVERTIQLDSIFGALSDPTRRDILKRVARSELSVSEVAKPYALSLAAVAKHIQILERARLIIKHRQGKEQMVHLAPSALEKAATYLATCENLWNARLNSLDKYLRESYESRNKREARARHHSRV